MATYDLVLKDFVPYLEVINKIITVSFRLVSIWAEFLNPIPHQYEADVLTAQSPCLAQ